MLYTFFKIFVKNRVTNRQILSVLRADYSFIHSFNQYLRSAHCAYYYIGHWRQNVELSKPALSPIYYCLVS